MLASSRRKQIERQGIVLVLVLGMLALMALIGITFATFSGQSRISARNYMQSMNQPQRDELMDYALSQLISDTPNRQSAIRGHSLARDMYGSDAAKNGYLAARPDGRYMAPNNDPYFYITAIAQVGTTTYYNLTTNIPSNDPTFYGYNFTRWNIRVSYQAIGVAGIVDQTLEVLVDSQYSQSTTTGRVLTVNIGMTEGNSVAATTGPPATPGTPSTKLINPTLASITTLPGQSLIAASGVPRFILDGRWLHAFNGPGMTTNAVHANFRYNSPYVPKGPNSQGMDEDYDAVDLENWFLAMQSADGSVMIPSFHRPSAIRIDSTVTPPIYDWGGPQNSAFENNATNNWNDSASRILRPRAADGHDASAFPDLVPGTNGQITYDVDNDGDGVTDSVWLDLGYPARRNASGQLYKPMFAFMVIGLNGRIPLNTAGNLANTATGIGYPVGTTPPTYTYGGGAAHAQHLGNSVSEIDPTYALQNAFDSTYDSLGAFNFPGPGGSTAMNTQVDNAGIDVRLTQLRNILAGTRPPQKSSFGTGTDGDTNYVAMETATGSGSQVNPPVAMPNGVADPFDTSPGTDATGTNPYVMRLTPPVAGRWGESGSVPGGIFDSNSPSPPAINNYLNVVQVTYNNPVRAGYSYDTSDAITDNPDPTNSNTNLPRDAADDNYNAFDPFPLGHNGEVNDSDSYDGAGALILPVDRMRRYVTPADINGTGSVTPWTNGTAAGADPLGRVLHKSYYRPPGTPGSIATSPSTPVGGTLPATVGNLGAIYYPSSSTTGTDFFYTQGPNNNPIPAPPATALAYPAYLPDVTNNPLHAFEFFKLPPIVKVTAPTKITNHILTTTATPPTLTFSFQFQQQRNPAMPLDGTVDAFGFPTAYPTYDFVVNSKEHTDGLNDADEMNLYVPNPQADSPFSANDLEWLYRQQDVDGATLTSRLAQLAPVSLTNSIDGQRRRRLFCTDTWEMNNFAWTNDNPGNQFPNNSRFTQTANASFATLNVAGSANAASNPNSSATGLLNPTGPPYYPFTATTTPPAPMPTPSLAHRDKKINLNYPLPVSNDPNESIRQKWVMDAYQLMKSVLPPKAVDTADELAALSQFLVNVVDFRDADCTMTHFRNPDVKMVLGSSITSPTYLAPIGAAIPATNTAIPLDQYGMEYNPIAINETLAYSFQRATSTPTNRFYVELLNTLSQTSVGVDNAAGGTLNAPDVSVLDLSLANYDMVIAADDPLSRPDPFTGQLLPIANANYYGQMPFNQASSGATPMFAPALAGNGDLQLLPGFPLGSPASPPAAVDFPAGYFYVIGNPSVGGTEKQLPTTNAILTTTYDPMMQPAPAPTAPPANVVPPGYSPNLASVAVAPATSQVVTGKPNMMPSRVPQVATKTVQNYWLCLRRPANPFAPPQPDISLVDANGHSTYNPMVVVDTMRFPYIEAGGTAGPPATIGKDAIYSSQRSQPYRGGHAVRLPGDATSAASPLFTPYGYSEQMAGPLTMSANFGYSGGVAGNAVSQKIYHTLGALNDQSEPWDYFPFNDRDFTSVAELMLVPGCPPGLFTKQFVELAPMPPSTSPTITSGYPLAQFPVSIPPPNAPTPPSPVIAPAVPGLSTGNAGVAFTPGTTGTAPAGVAQPHTYPYLVDKFFYTAYGSAGSATTLTPDPGGVVDGPGADGWFKMFEFFEVPSQSLGAIGTVAQGTDFDWARQDMKPGLININLIIDEEVFFSVLGSQSITLANGAAGGNTDSFTQNLLDFAELPISSPDIPQVVTASLASGAANSSTPVWGLGGSHPGVLTNDPNSTGGGAFNGMKAAFAQFLVLRHGANLNPTGTPLIFSANPERPFHSLSYPDINYTVMRPANLPPATPVLPTMTSGYTSGSYSQDSALRNPYITPASPPSGIVSGTSFVANVPTVVVPPTASSYGVYYSGLTSYVSLPSPIPPRRLFQIPDAYTNGSSLTFPPTAPPYATPTTTPAPPATWAPAVSNASDSGDPFVNVVALNATTNLAAGALGTIVGSAGTYYVNNGYPNIVWSGNTLNTQTSTSPTQNYLGANNSSKPDNSQHPYWRSEMMQKVINLTTVRTHQYAVWITIGFFEVKREGDLGMLAQGAPLLAYDLLGPEIGAASGTTTRFRGFFLIDRTQLYGFDDTTPGSFRPAVIYRQMIE